MLLHKYILRTHLIPFVFSLLTLFCIFLLQFLMKFADRLVGKGLDTWVIIQLIVFNLSWMVALVVPMATLIASLMAFGNMSQNNEITIIKSSGVSLYKMMIAPLAASIVVAYLLVLFNNDVLPDANHQAKILMQDISRKKPTLSLEPGIFSQEVSNYAILAREVDPKSNHLSEVTIYDYTDPRKINVVTAEKGEIFFSKDQTKLIMDLTNGEIHESDIYQSGTYRKLVFNTHRITMDAEQFSFQQSAPGGTRGERELSTSDMLIIVDSLQKKKNEYENFLVQETQKQMFLQSVQTNNVNEPNPKHEVVYMRLINKLKTAKNLVISSFKRVEYAKSEIDKYMVEVHKKYSIPVACIVFVLIGAPLGVMVKKGGFGVAASISLFFFLIYWSFLIGGEKLSERGFFSPFWGMWSANILLGIAGILLILKSVRENVTINFSSLKRLFRNNCGKQKKMKMKIIDKYLIKQFLQTIFFGLLAFTLLFVVIDMIENMDDFIDRHVTFDIILHYYLVFSPEIIKLMTPVAVLFAALFTAGKVANLSELTAIKASGVSLYRFMSPFLITTIIISLLSIYFAGYVVPSANRTKVNIEMKYLNKGFVFAGSNIFFQDSRTKIISISFFDANANQANQVSIQDFNPDNLTEMRSRIDAVRLLYDSTAGNWIAKNGVERKFTQSGQTAKYFESLAINNLHFTPSDLLSKQQKPEEMDLPILRN